MKRRILDFMMTACCMVFSFLALVACDNELDIRQEYPFTVESMPVADEIVNGETVEIRLEIKPEGNYFGVKLITGEHIFNQFALFELIKNYKIVKNDELTAILGDLANLPKSKIKDSAINAMQQKISEIFAN